MLSEIVILFALILLNGLFAGSELAMVSARKTRLRSRATAGHRGARVALELLANPTKLFSTVQIGITLVGILTGVYSGAVFAEDLAVPLREIESIAPYAEETAFAIVVVIITYLSLVFGELVPKRFALAHAETLAEFVSIPMLWISRIAFPLVWLLRVSTELAARLLPLSPQQASITDDEVRSLVAAGAKEGVFLKREKEMIESVLRLADRSVVSIMVPRGEIIWLDARSPIEEMWHEARASGHSRFILAEGALEEMVGVITLGDLGDALRVGKIDSGRHVRPALHVPPSVSSLKLLDLFRDSNVHLAIVTGEYGEIDGLVTPADVLKAIAGEMGDVAGSDQSEAVRRDDGSWLMDGQLSIHDAERLLERTDLSHGDDYHTVAGFILWHLTRVPVAGETLDWRDLRFEVVDMDGRRIDKVILSQRRSRNGDKASEPSP